MFKTRQSIFKTSSGQRTFNYRATKLWNKLDSKYKEITSFIIFKGHWQQKILFLMSIILTYGILNYAFS